jgi:hypothetical protein
MVQLSALLFWMWMQLVPGSNGPSVNFFSQQCCPWNLNEKASKKIQKLFETILLLITGP